MALEEDRAFHDVTTRLIPVKNKKTARASIISREIGIFCHGDVTKFLFRQLDPRAEVKVLKKDGSKIKKDEIVVRIKARPRAILGAERTVLNMMCSLSGIATLTRAYVEAVRGTGVDIYDTRKTMPLWRDLEKHAVLCGGGKNHRMSLEDAILVKDNHHSLIKEINSSTTQIYGQGVLRKKHKISFVEFEAQNYKQVWDGIKARADVIMLDNMRPEQIKGAVKFIGAARKALDSKKPFIEISGGVTLKNVKLLSKLGVDRISIGSLTHSAPALNFSLEVC